MIVDRATSLWYIDYDNLSIDDIIKEMKDKFIFKKNMNTLIYDLKQKKFKSHKEFKQTCKDTGIAWNSEKSISVTVQGFVGSIVGSGHLIIKEMNKND